MLLCLETVKKRERDRNNAPFFVQMTGTPHLLTVHNQRRRVLPSRTYHCQPPFFLGQTPTGEKRGEEKVFRRLKKKRHNGKKVLLYKSQVIEELNKCREREKERESCCCCCCFCHSCCSCNGMLQNIIRGKGKKKLGQQYSKSDSDIAN